MHVVSELEKLQARMRIGFPQDFEDVSGRPDLSLWSAAMAQQIKRVEAEFANREASWGATEIVRFAGLRSEYHDVLGQTDKAVNVLKPYLLPRGTAITDQVDEVRALGATLPRLGTSAEDERYARWIRQIGWLHLQIAWVVHFRRGESERALQYLDEVRAFLDRKLITKHRPSYGTLFRYYYYKAHCERTLRNFPASLKSFKDANANIRNRYEQKKERLKGKVNGTELEARLAQEKLFATISTARILGGGLALNALHQGRLTRAIELCLSAETLLLQTGQEPLRLFIRSHMAVAARRAAPASVPEAGKAMKDLLRLEHQYKVAGDSLGQMRCGFEYVRGHIDYLLCWSGSPADRKNSIRHGRAALNRLDQIAQNAEDPSWRERSQLLGSRIKLAETDGEPHASDHLPSSKSADLNIEKQIIWVLGQQRSWTDLAINRKCVNALNGSLASLSGRPDPVVQAEVHLLLARLKLEAVDLAGTDEELRYWEARSYDIENAYLHRIAENTRALMEKRMEPFIIRPDALDLTWKKHERELRKWLGRAAAQRIKHTDGKAAPPGKGIAEILGIDASTWSRWQREI